MYLSKYHLGLTRYHLGLTKYHLGLTGIAYAMIPNELDETKIELVLMQKDRCLKKEYLITAVYQGNWHLCCQNDIFVKASDNKICTKEEIL